MSDYDVGVSWPGLSVFVWRRYFVSSYETTICSRRAQIFLVKLIYLYTAKDDQLTIFLLLGIPTQKRHGFFAN